MNWTFLVGVAMFAVVGRETCLAELPRLQVSDNGHYLVKEDGRPFFYLADTGWELFHRLTREEAAFYLKTRADQGFNVIQAVALAELNGLNDPNPYGHRPLENNDPSRPLEKAGPRNDYWDHVDELLGLANRAGLYVALLPTWGDKWLKAWGAGPEVFNSENAEAYGRWIAERFRHRSIIWVLGGDRSPEIPKHLAIIRSMAKGIRQVAGPQALMTFHPRGGRGSADWFHDDGWLSLNMRQNGHGDGFPGYGFMKRDYDRLPAKPLLDAEPLYEDQPIHQKANEAGYSIAADVRRVMYWDVFQGACGHAYGHHSVSTFHTAERTSLTAPLMEWQDALGQPGATQMVHLRHLMESRPYLTRIPDDTILVSTPVAAAVLGGGLKRLVGTRDANRTFAMVYTPAGRPFSVRMAAISGEKASGWWFNPRTGEASRIGDYETRGEREFSPPALGEQMDWVLVLDDASQGFVAPGTTAK